MRIANLAGWCGALLLTTAFVACSSSNDGGSPSGTGGAGGAAGGLGSGGAPVTCDASGCTKAQQLVTSVIGAEVSTCCVDSVTCGLDYSTVPATNALAPFLPKVCSIPVPLPEAGAPPPPVVVQDGGIIEVPDGGPPILLDSTCSGASIPPLSSLPGCCQPNGFCGSSTHPLAALGLPLECFSNAALKGTAAGRFASVPPEKGCTYEVPGQPTVTGHLPDGGTGSADSGKEGGVPEAGAKDAGPRSKDGG